MKATPLETINSHADPAHLFDPFARFYDGDYRDYVEDLQLVTDLVQESGGPVLEMGCGTGRVLLPLAAGGVECTGIDLSPALLAVAKAKLAQANLAQRVTLIQGDMRTVDLSASVPAGFGMVCCMSNTLMHLPTQADQRMALERAYAHLRPGGWLLLDLFSPDIPRLLQVDGLQELADSWPDPDTGATVYKWVVRRLNLADQIQETLFIYEEIFPDGRVQRTPCPFSLRFLWPSEGELLLELAGFDVVESWGDFDGNPIDDASERLIFWARKPEQK